MVIQYLIVNHILGIRKLKKLMALASCFGKMEQNMKVNLEMVNYAEREEKSLLMENIILVSLKMIKQMEKEHLLI